MEDTNRILEQKALRNVRALVDNLERHEPVQPWGQLLVLGILLAVAVVAVWITSLRQAAAEAASQQQLSCELDAWNAKAAEFERGFKQSNPELSYREIQAHLERERPFFMDAARTDCNFKREDTK